MVGNTKFFTKMNLALSVFVLAGSFMIKLCMYVWTALFWHIIFQAKGKIVGLHSIDKIIGAASAVTVIIVILILIS